MDFDQEPNKSTQRLVLLIVVVFFCRIVFAVIAGTRVGSEAFFRGDTTDYYELAKSLLHGSFSSPGFYSPPGTPEICRTPGYPLVLAVAVLSHHWIVVGLLEGFLFAAISTWLVWKIVMEAGLGPTAAFAAAFLYSVEPLSFIYSAALMSETLFTTLFLLFLWLWLRSIRRPSSWMIALSAICLACAAYVRPVVLYLPLGLASLYLFLARRTQWKYRSVHALVFLATFYAALAPWVVRNAKLADYSSLSSAQDLNLYFYSASALRAKLEHRPWEEEWPVILTIRDSERYFRDHPEQRSWSEGQVARFMRTSAATYLFQHVPEYALIHLTGCMHVAFHPGVTELLVSAGSYREGRLTLLAQEDKGAIQTLIWLVQLEPIVAVLFPLLAIQMLAYYALGLGGFRRLSADLVFTFGLLILYFIVVSGFPGAGARFRVPVMPLVSIGAGVAIAQLVAKKRAQNPAFAQKRMEYLASPSSGSSVEAGVK